MPLNNAKTDESVANIFKDWFDKGIAVNPNLATKINQVYRFNLTNYGKILSTWVLDLADGKGSLYKDDGKDVKCCVTIEEDDLLSSLKDTTALRDLFFKRKMRLTGSRVALEKLQQFWVEMNTKDNQKANTLSIENNVKEIIDAIPINGIKSEILFHSLKNRLIEEQDIVRRLTGVLNFVITKNSENATVWTIDFKSELGSNVYPGEPKNNKADCILTVDDEDFFKLMTFTYNPQKLFISGKVRIKGQMLLIYNLYTVWSDAVKNKGKAPELTYITKLLEDKPMIPGLKSEVSVFEMIQRLVKQKNLCQEPGGVYYFNITKNGNSASKWKLDFTINENCGVFSRINISVNLPEKLLFTVDDTDFALIVFNGLSITNAFSSGRIQGDINLAKSLEKIFKWPSINSKL